MIRLVVRWSVGCLALLTVLASCADAGPVEVQDAAVGTRGTRLLVSIDRCTNDVDIEAIESDEEVVLYIRVNSVRDGDCGGAGYVDLDSPLGDRRVVDRATGQEVTVMTLDEELPPAAVGLWYLEWIEVSGERIDVVVGENAAQQPWVSIVDRVEGNAGCNGFVGDRDGFSVDRDRLDVGEVIINASLCGSDDGADVMKVERIFTHLLWNSEAGIELEVTRDAMLWTSGVRRAQFVAASELPEIESPPVFEVGRLVCSPRTVDRAEYVGNEADPVQLVLNAAPEVTRYEVQAPSWWWGYDADGVVVAAVAKGDIEPPRWEVFTCADE